MTELVSQMNNSINAAIASGQYNAILDIVKAYRNGFVYGVKIRAPHALVMALLFKRGPTLTDMLTRVFNQTKQHALTLGKFAALFKIGLLLLRLIDNDKSNQGLHAFVSGAIVGTYVWGSNNAINMQINLYLLSRIMMGFGRIFISKLHEYKVRPTADAPNNTFKTFACLAWGFVMYLFYEHPKLLQESLQSSMKYIYQDSTKYSNLRTLIIHNE